MEAPVLNVQPPTVVENAENVRLVRFEVPKKAVPVGTVPELQLEPVLKLLLPGLVFHVASCAAAGCGAALRAAHASNKHRPAPAEIGPALRAPYRVRTRSPNFGTRRIKTPPVRRAAGRSLGAGRTGASPQSGNLRERATRSNCLDVQLCQCPCDLA